MNNISKFTQCANCGACYNICPVKAITVEGGMFYNVRVDNEKCIECGLCKRVCPVNTPTLVQTLQNAYAAIHNTPLIVKESSSGGVFSAIAETVLDEGGVVFGAVFTENCQAVEMKSTEDVSLDALRRSKYVESQVGQSFRSAKAALEDGKTVLYCGAPCQIAGLKRYLQKDYENLITCDFSCGGMPSNELYRQYLRGIEKKLHSPIKEVNFRPKIYGWQHHAIKIKGMNNRIYRKLAQNDPFFYCFLYNRYIVRDYCYECAFADNHYSDLILADFWKCESLSKVRNGVAGISLVITNSEKGERLLSANTKKLALTVIGLEKGTYNIRKKTTTDAFMHARSSFLKECGEKGFWTVMRKIKLPSTWKFKIKYFLYIKRKHNTKI